MGNSRTAKTATSKCRIGHAISVGSLALGLALGVTAPVDAARNLNADVNTDLVVVSGEATLHLELDGLTRRADSHVITVYVLEEFDGRGRGLTVVSSTEVTRQNTTATVLDLAVDDFRQDYVISVEALSKRGKVLNQQFINYRPTCANHPTLSDCAVGELAGFDIRTDGSTLTYSAGSVDGGSVDDGASTANERWQVTVFEFDRQAEGPAPVVDEIVLARNNLPFERSVTAETAGASLLYSITYFQGDTRVDSWTGLVPRTQLGE